MTAVTNINQAFRSEMAQTTALQEGPIKGIPSEIAGPILYFANSSESTRLVCRHWNQLTFAVVKHKNQELQQIIPQIIEKLDPNTQLQCIAELYELQDAHQINSGSLYTFPEGRRIFLTDKGRLVRILRELPLTERDELQNRIDEILPDSLKDIIEISGITLQNVGINLDTFFTLLQSYQPLSMGERTVTIRIHSGFCKNIEFVQLLLADGPIDDWARGQAVQSATSVNNLECVKLLLANGPIPHEDRRWASLEAALNRNLRLVQVLADKWIVAELGVGAVLLGGIGWCCYKLYEQHNKLNAATIAHKSWMAEQAIAHESWMAEQASRMAELQSRMANLEAELVKLKEMNFQINF